MDNANKVFGKQVTMDEGGRSAYIQNPAGDRIDLSLNGDAFKVYLNGYLTDYESPRFTNETRALIYSMSGFLRLRRVAEWIQTAEGKAATKAQAAKDNARMHAVERAQRRVGR